MKRRGNGEGTVERINSHNFKAIAVVGWKDDTHPIRRTKAGFRTAREAREYIPILKGERPNDRCIADYWATIEEQVSRMDGATQRKYRLAYERVQSIARVPIDTIRIDMLNNLVKGLTSNSALSVKNLLSKAYQLAMAEQVCYVNLALLMTLPTDHAEVPKTPFAKGEIGILWSAWHEQKDRVLAVVLLCCYTGMMPIEICRTTTDNVQNQTIVGIGAKTEKRRTSAVIVPTLAMPVLSWLCDNAVDGRLLPMTEKQYRTAFKKLMARLGLNTDHTPYDCRHTTATLLQDSLEPNALTELMRHTKLITTQHYKHRQTQELIEQVDKALLST